MAIIGNIPYFQTNPYTNYWLAFVWTNDRKWWADPVGMTGMDVQATANGRSKQGASESLTPGYGNQTGNTRRNHQKPSKPLETGDDQPSLSTSASWLIPNIRNGLNITCYFDVAGASKEKWKGEQHLSIRRPTDETKHVPNQHRAKMWAQNRLIQDFFGSNQCTNQKSSYEQKVEPSSFMSWLQPSA